MKDNIRDYATDAFYFFSRNGKNSKTFKERIYQEAKVSIEKGGGSGIAKPTESAIMQAQQERTWDLAQAQLLTQGQQMATLLY